MPTATLRFNLPEDKSDYYFANKGADYYFVLWDLDQFLRGEIKYKDKPAGAEEIRDKLHELMGDRNINFDEIE